jgi:hypothetical protein
MSLEDRRKLVAKNKHKGAGKGVRRNVIVSDQASCVDSLKLQQDKPFLTKKQFLIQVIFFQAFFGLSVIPQCRLFRPHWLYIVRCVVHVPWCLDPRFMAELEARYEWSKEELEGEWEAAKSNPNAVWSKDDYGVEVVSLLKKTSSSSARELQHAKSVTRSNETESENMEEIFSGFLFECSTTFVSIRIF